MMGPPTVILFFDNVFPKNIHNIICACRGVVWGLRKYGIIKGTIEMNVLYCRNYNKRHFGFFPAVLDILSFYIFTIIILRKWHIRIIEQLDRVLYRFIPDQLLFEVF